MSPRKMSQTSRASLVSYTAKVCSTPVTLDLHADYSKLSEADPSHDVNIAVLGNASVGKSTFIQRTLDLDDEELSQPPSRILSISGNLCMVRMFEMKLDEVYQGEDNPLKWPPRVGSTQIHGVMTLYSTLR